MRDARLGQTRHTPARRLAAPPGPTATERGLLAVPATGGGTPMPAGADFRLDRLPVAADLADLVERHWLVTWSLPAGRRSAATLLPHPCVNLVFAGGAATIAGVGTARFSYPLTGSGRVYGVKFRPGGFRPFLGGPVWQLTDRSRPLSTLWGDGADVLAAELAAAADFRSLAAAAERHLRARWPAPDPEVARVAAIVRALLSDRTVTRVDEVAARFGLSPRSLQRLFQRYVGVSPKWVLRRYRLHEAAARLAEGTGASWAEVAADLGYFDQSHFIRDFAGAVGMTPAAYAEAHGSRGAPVSA